MRSVDINDEDYEKIAKIAAAKGVETWQVIKIIIWAVDRHGLLSRLCDDDDDFVN